MKTKVLLIYPHLHNKEFMYARIPPLGLEYIAAYILDSAQVRILDYRFEKNVRRVIGEYEPDIVGISVLNCVRAHDAYRVAAMCRKAGAGMIVAGGLHATICPEEALEKGFDAVVRGEGETTFAEIVKKGCFRGVKGITYKNRGAIIRGRDAPLVENIDELPLPARRLRSPKTDYSFNRGMMKADVLSTSRGCTGACDFCSPAVFYRGRWRALSPERVMEDLRAIEAKWILLSDDHFMGDPDRIERLCDLIVSEGVRKEFSFQTRMVPGREKLKRKMAEAGFRAISFGVEGTSQDRVARYGKNMSVGEIKKYIRGWREAGAIFINGSFVFAHPDDSKEELLSFGDFARELDLDYADFIFLTPYPGTKVFDEYERAGRILHKDWRKYTQGTLLVKHPELNDPEMRTVKRLAFMRFMSPRKISRMLRFIAEYASPDGENEKPLTAALKALRAGFLNRHLLFGNHYEASAFHNLPEYEGEEISRKEMLRVYFGEQMEKFPAHELEVTEGMDVLLRSFAPERALKLMRRLDATIIIKDKRKTLTRLIVKIRNGRVVSAAFNARPADSGLRIPFDINTIPI